jgi:glycosyltransferase involved in cell wall biosynthesis
MTLNQQLTVVLPMHNMERQIRSSVHDLLDLSVLIRTPFEIVIVDDGSTDDTFETACEMARTYPQIRVLRQSFRSGLGSALELVRNRLDLDMAIVHDGVSPIDPAELKELLLNEPQPAREVAAVANGLDARGSRRFAAVRTLQRSMEIAHRAVIGFSWLRIEKPLVPRRRQVVEQPKSVSPVLTTLPTANYLTTLPGGIMGLPLA